jgi:hypothetical protein
MKTKYSICILMLLSLMFAFTSCVKDELDTWVSIEVIKTEVVADGTKVTFNVSGNAETYVIYTGDAGHEFAKSYLVLTQGQKIDQEEYVLTQAKLDTWWETPITGLKAEIDTWNAVPANTPIDKVAVFAGLKKLVDIPYYLDTAAQRLRELIPTLKTYSQCVNLVSKDNYFSNKYVLSQAKLDTWTPFLTAEIDAWNAVPANTPIDKVIVFAKLKSLVNTLYYFDDAKNLLIGILSPFKTDIQCEALLTSNTSYFTKNKVLLAPVGGFSKGVALNRNNLTYSYIFKTPGGPYTVTVLGTKIGQKNYSGSGYIDDRTSSAGEYNYGRNTATVVVP